MTSPVVRNDSQIERECSAAICEEIGDRLRINMTRHPDDLLPEMTLPAPDTLPPISLKLAFWLTNTPTVLGTLAVCAGFRPIVFPCTRLVVLELATEVISTPFRRLPERTFPTVWPLMPGLSATSMRVSAATPSGRYLVPVRGYAKGGDAENVEFSGIAA